MPDDEHGYVSGGNAVSDVYRSVVPWDRGHKLSGRVKVFSARTPHWCVHRNPWPRGREVEHVG